MTYIINTTTVSANFGNGNKNPINYCSIGTSSGLWEYFLPQIGFNSSVSCEIDKQRARFYTSLYPTTHMVAKSIADSDAKAEIIDWCKKTNVQLIIESLPCQGSTPLSGKNKQAKSVDPRNKLFIETYDVVKGVLPTWFIRENVPQYYKNTIYGYTSEWVMRLQMESIGYTVIFVTLNAADYGTAQRRVRRYMLAYRGNKEWFIPEPTTPNHPTVREMIERLPVLESSGKSDIPYHNAITVRADLVDLIKHTPEGGNIKNNPAPYNVAYRKDGITPQKYKFGGVLCRASWDKPAHTITTGSGGVMGQYGLHPGKFIGYDSTGLPLYDNARPFTIKELMLLTGLPDNFQFPANMSETQMRIALGEQACPLMLKMFLQNRPTN